MQDELRQKKHVLYENTALVRELERFFNAAVAAATRGHKLRDWTGRAIDVGGTAFRRDS